MLLEDARQLTFELMEQHQLTGKGWSFKFDNAKERFGMCSYRRKNIHLSQILVPILDEAAVNDTILHEIAHALVGAGHGHDNVWKRKAREIGANPERCGHHDTSAIQAKYEATCVNCGINHKAHRRPKRSQWCWCERKRFRPEMKLNYIQNF